MSETITDNHLYTGLQLLGQKYYEQALQYLELAVEKEPNAFNYQKLGFCLMKIEKLDTARYNLQKSIELDDTQWEAYMYLGNLSYDQGDFVDSIEHFQKALKNHKDKNIFDILELKAIEENKDNFNDFYNKIVDWQDMKPQNKQNQLGFIFKAIFGAQIRTYHTPEKDLEQFLDLYIGQYQAKIKYEKNRINIDYYKFKVMLEEMTLQPQASDENIGQNLRTFSDQQIGMDFSKPEEKKPLVQQKTQQKTQQQQEKNNNKYQINNNSCSNNRSTTLMKREKDFDSKGCCKCTIF